MPPHFFRISPFPMLPCNQELLFLSNESYLPNTDLFFSNNSLGIFNMTPPICTEQRYLHPRMELPLAQKYSKLQIAKRYSHFLIVLEASSLSNWVFLQLQIFLMAILHFFHLRYFLFSFQIFFFDNFFSKLVSCCSSQQNDKVIYVIKH